MAQITSREELEVWLKDKPADFVQVIATRFALRVLPYAFRKNTSNEWVAVHSIVLFRASAIPWGARNFPFYDMHASVKRASQAAVDVIHNRIAWSHSGSYSIATSAADLTRPAVYAEFLSESFGVYRADSRYSALSANLSADCDWLDKTSSPPTDASRLTHEPLWPAGELEGWAEEWGAATRRLAALGQGYDVWIDWYNRRVKGERSAFDIPGDHDRTEDKKILARLADATNEDFWDKGAEYVNTTLQGWIDEARERVAPPSKPSKAELQAAVIKYASPDARIVDDQLDAGPNATFDKPRYDGDLATLPSQLRAFIGALSASLPRNAPDVIRHCLTAYADELLVRGTQPIVSIVKGMASAIAAQVWIAPGDADKDNPDTWVLKDPREWESGTADLFRTFFKAHLDLITHFPLDPEREAMLAATPIDEVAASDKALTDPIDKVTDLIITLAKDGHATDNIVRIVKALADYTRDIAGMPKPDEADLPSTTITPKRRHVLQTAGFYLHAYSILGTTAQLATLPQVQALMTALADAAERLMGFIL